MNQLNQQLKHVYEGKAIDINDLRNIFSEFGKLNDKCRVDEQVLAQLMDILADKSESISYSNIEDLLFTYFLVQEEQIYDKAEIESFVNFCVEVDRQPGKPIPTEISVDLVTRVADQLLRETGHQIAYFEALTNLRDTNDNIALSAIKSAFGIAFPNKTKQLTIDTSAIQSPRSEISSMRGLSTSKQFNQIFTPGTNQLKGLFNLGFQRLDQMKRYLGKNKQADRLLKELIRIQKKLETEVDRFKESKQNTSQEDLGSDQRLNDLEHEVRRYQEQIAQMIDDNEALCDQLEGAKLEIETLTQRNGMQSRQMSEDEDSINTLASQIRKKEIEIRDLREETQKLQRENNHLQENNRSLLSMLDKLEQSHNEELQRRHTQGSTDQAAKFNESALIYIKQQLTLSDNENRKLHEELEYYKTQLKYAQDHCQSLEDQLQNCKREQFKYKKLFDEASEEIVTQRKSIARMSVMGLQSLKGQQVSARQSIALGNQHNFSKLVAQNNKADEIQEESDEGSSSDGSSEQSKKSTKKESDVVSIKDFLKMAKFDRIKEILEEEREKYEPQFQRILSCEIIMVSKTETECIFKEKMFLFLTDYQFIIFEDVDQDFKVHVQRYIADIRKITLSQSNPKLCGFTIDNHDIHFSCVHRSDLTVFLTDTFIMRKLPLFRQVFSKDVSRKQSTIQLDVKSSRMETNLFRMEYAEIYISGEWLRHFLMLCNIGILVFSEPCDVIPQLLILLNNATLVKNPVVQDREIKHAIKIAGDVEHLIKLQTEYEQTEWFEKMKIVCKQFN